MVPKPAPQPTLKAQPAPKTEPPSNGNLDATQEPRKYQCSTRSQNGAPFEWQPRCNRGARLGNNLITCLSSDISGRHLRGQTLRIHQSQAVSPVCSVRPTNQNSQSGAPFEWQPRWNTNPTTLQGSSDLNATQGPRKLQSSTRSQNGAPLEWQPRCNAKAKKA